jgi:hypothetical protein
MFRVVRDVAKLIGAGLLFGVLMAAVLGPLLTFFMWQNISEVRLIQAEGVEATATIVAARMKQGKKTGTTYYFDLSWRDDQGKVQKVTDVELSDVHAEKIASRQGLKTEYLRIKYLPSDPAQLIMLDDTSKDEVLLGRSFKWIIIISILGLVGALPAYMLMQRSDRREEAEMARDPEGTRDRNEKAAWIMVCLIFYLPFVGMHFDPDVHAKDVEIFGPAPFGLPVRLVVILVTTIAFLPFAWIFRQMARAARQKD